MEAALSTRLVQQYSLSLQLCLGANDSLELAYVGTKGTHLAQNYDLNEPVASAKASTANEQARRPNAGIAILNTEAPIGYSNYGGAQVTYHHRVSSGLVHIDAGQPFSASTSGADNSPRTKSAFAHRWQVELHAFAVNAACTLGTSPRNGCRSAPNYQTDTALLKTLALTERYGLMFRAEAFNVINHANYYAPLVSRDTANATNFGTYQAARDPRQLQFALKFLF